MSKKDHVEIIYPSSIEGETAIDLIPEPGADGREFDRFSSESTWQGRKEFEAACEADWKVHMEVLDMVEELQAWVNKKVLQVKSKPARDMLSMLNEWAEEQKYRYLDAE